MLNNFQKYQVRALSINTRYKMWSIIFNFKKQIRANDKNLDLLALIIFDDERRYAIYYKNVIFHENNKTTKIYSRFQKNIDDFDHEKIISNYHVHVNDIDKIQVLKVNSNENVDQNEKDDDSRRLLFSHDSNSRRLLFNYEINLFQSFSRLILSEYAIIKNVTKKTKLRVKRKKTW